LLVINKDDVWEYINAIKDHKGRRYYSVNIKKNKSSVVEWEYITELKRQIKKPKVWDDFSELKSLYLDKKKWEKINKHYEEKRKYIGIKKI